MGVHVAAVAGEVLQNAADPAIPHGGDHVCYIVGGSLGVLPQGPVIDEIGGVGGHIRHRGQVHIDAQGQQRAVFLPGVCGKDVVCIRLPLLLGQGLGGGEGGVKEVGVPTGPGNGAALLVHADEQGDARVRHGSVLVALHRVRELFFGKPSAPGVLIVPAEEEIASQMVGSHVLRGAVGGTADEKTVEKARKKPLFSDQTGS